MARVAKLLIAQGGGPTVVINQSLAGIIEEARARGVAAIWGAAYGVRGILEKRLTDLSSLGGDALERIAATPSAALGTTRHKPDDADCRAILELAKKRAIDAFFYIGGNDSSATLDLLAGKARQQGYPLRCLHVPKTIDNDLVENDHTPGYGSAARYVALAAAGLNLDQRALPGVHIAVVMGRHAGFLTAAACALREREDDGPHLVCLPETPFDADAFLSRLDSVYRKLGRCLIALSEGVADDKGKPLAATLTKAGYDPHGNVQLSGHAALGDGVAKMIQQKLGINRVRADTLGYMQRCFPACVSLRDCREARETGREAVRRLCDGDDDGSITLTRRRNGETAYGFVPLAAVAGRTRFLPKEHRQQDGFGVTQDFLAWLRPLLGEGLPRFARLDHPPPP